ncbi:MAG: hypothetical protein M1817_001536 [Caeruleum heppii]|nr:MAG: hypothetical protein M1817_001536 [Caeruleum heppii]
MMWFRGLVAASLTAAVRAQANAGGDQSVCSVAQAFQYRGCYGDLANGAHVSYNYPINNIASDPKGYPGFNDAQLNFQMCLTSCRGHGFRHAALYAANSCWCGIQQPSTQTLGSNANDNTTTNECHVQPMANNGCPGNRMQWCGSGSASDVYADPSFPNIATAGQGANYRYLGCFTTANPGDFHNNGLGTIAVANIAGCHNYCAQFGYPYAGLESATGCRCGTAFEVGLQALTESQCNFACAVGE